MDKNKISYEMIESCNAYHIALFERILLIENWTLYQHTKYFLLKFAFNK